MMEKGITDAPNSGAQEGRRLPTNPGCFLTAKPSAPEEALAGQLDWPRLHSCYRKESPWRLHPAKQKSKVFIPLWRAEQAELPQPGEEGERSQSYGPGAAGPAEEEG